MTPEDIRRLKCARDLLDHPGLAVKLTNVIGIPFEKAIDRLPKKWAATIQTITRKSLHHALDAAVKTIGCSEKKASRDTFHKLS